MFADHLVDQRPPRHQGEVITVQTDGGKRTKVLSNFFVKLGKDLYRHTNQDESEHLTLAIVDSPGDIEHPLAIALVFDRHAGEGRKADVNDMRCEIVAIGKIDRGWWKGSAEIKDCSIAGDECGDVDDRIRTHLVLEQSE